MFPRPDLRYVLSVIPPIYTIDQSADLSLGPFIRTYAILVIRRSDLLKRRSIRLSRSVDLSVRRSIRSVLFSDPIRLSDDQSIRSDPSDDQSVRSDSSERSVYPIRSFRRSVCPIRFVSKTIGPTHHPSFTFHRTVGSGGSMRISSVEAPRICSDSGDTRRAAPPFRPTTSWGRMGVFPKHHIRSLHPSERLRLSDRNRSALSTLWPTLTGPPSWVSTRSVHRARLSCRSARLAELASPSAGLAHLAELASSSSLSSSPS
ncbi:hypothetical protein ISN45_Aa02g010830 [Arabidopsis thaliana x Arabidopsis arenosa]|uniref:Uncharacterized protein n=1 Tax=Arabidopsis thaliana x Arabidopsis arenosa TaxID=1240361 RepID=A0A8T2BIA5_9BRAS|nr:hypothetical protein ISN45_Aa02g010830 [Arabidopsis thaliana x Arabidopsis arenosa]